MSYTWSGDAYNKKLEKELGRNLEATAIYYKGKVKEALNRSQPYSRGVGQSGIWYRGLEPSLPGEPPKKVRETYNGL